MLKILLAGGSGFLGRHLVKNFLSHQYNVAVLTRRTDCVSSGDSLRYVQWDPRQGGIWASQVEGADAVINLCGESVAQGRWSIARKRAILESRLFSVRALAEGIIRMKERPRVFINASAVGYYGDSGERELIETDPSGKDFLANVCSLWEKEAVLFEARGIRTVCLRLGVVLGLGGGALEKLLLPFRMGLGGPLGRGEQWMSWVHIDDVFSIARWALTKDQVRGPVNVTAPYPVTNFEFSKSLGRALGRPALLPMPALALRAILGEMSEMFLGGQKVLPRKALENGFEFAYPKIDEALKNLLIRASPGA